MGPEHFEDAGVYRLNETTAIVQTLDFFPPLVDDPYTFGQIAAANSLSDLYAMGAKPITAMNIVGFPDQKLPAAVLHEILRGGGERVAEAGAVILGGHSVRDAEVKYGLSVTGTIHPDHIITNAGAQVGDALVLTKPIGSGVLTSAAKQRKIPEHDLEEAVGVMITLNKGAANAMTKVGIHAATDITGFGLLGHAFEMADASGVSLEIEAGAVPLLRQTRALAQRGFLTRACRASRAFLGDRLDVGRTEDVLVNVLADAQTSGGLLISVAPDTLADLRRALQDNATPSASVIGKVTSRRDTTIRMR